MNAFKKWYEGVQMIFKGMDNYLESEKEQVKDKGGRYASAEAINNVLREKLSPKFMKNCKLHIVDSEYYCPSVDYVKAILKLDRLDTQKYRPEAFDCDDFAFILKASFTKLTYKNTSRRAPFSLAMTYGMIPTPHAVNLFVDDQGELYFIEPQSDEIFLYTDARIKGIWAIIL